MCMHPFVQFVEQGDICVSDLEYIFEPPHLFFNLAKSARRFVLTFRAGFAGRHYFPFFQMVIPSPELVWNVPIPFESPKNLFKMNKYIQNM